MTSEIGPKSNCKKHHYLDAAQGTLILFTMPLLQKPRNPNYGIKQKHNPNKWRRFQPAVLRETADYLVAVQDTMSMGKLIDVAIKLYRERRHELMPAARIVGRRERLSTTASPDTLAYVEFMKSAMTPGELVNEAIRLYRQINEHEVNRA